MLVAAADRQHRPEIAEHDQQHEGDDVVGDRDGSPSRGRRRAFSARLLLVVAGEPAQQVAEHPGEQRSRSRAAPTVQGSARPIRVDDRRREGRQRRAEIADGDAAPEGDVLLAQACRSGRRARAATGASARSPRGWCCRTEVDGGDRLLDRIDRRRVGDDEGEVDADEDDEQRTGRAASATIAGIARCMRRAAVVASGVRREPRSPARPARRTRAHCFGFSFTIMYLELPQFGTGSV